MKKTEFSCRQQLRSPNKTLHLHLFPYDPFHVLKLMFVEGSNYWNDPSLSWFPTSEEFYALKLGRGKRKKKTPKNLMSVVDLITLESASVELLFDGWYVQGFIWLLVLFLLLRASQHAPWQLIFALCMFEYPGLLLALAGRACMSSAMFLHDSGQFCELLICFI